MLEEEVRRLSHVVHIREAQLVSLRDQFKEHLEEHPTRAARRR
jgi:hypothetical protein